MVCPQSINATEGSRISFYCLINGASRYRWYLNNTNWLYLTAAQKRTIATGLEHNAGNLVSYFRFNAEHTFNNSVIQCLGEVSTNHYASTDHAHLMIQGMP